MCGVVVEKQPPCSLVVRRRWCGTGACATVWYGGGGDELAAPMQQYDAEEQVMGRVPVKPCGAEEEVMDRAYHHERREERWRDGRGMQRGGGVIAPMETIRSRCLCWEYMEQCCFDLLRCVFSIQTCVHFICHPSRNMIQHGLHIMYPL